jgi:nucleoside-diphosphate-sugar epimerase
MNTNELHVIFGAGPLGKSVMRALVARGAHVRMVNRSGKAANLPAKVEIVAADAYNTTQVREAAKSATHIYQCAQPPYTEWQEKFPPLQTSVLEGAAALDAKLIVGENLYLYGDVDVPMMEDLPANPNTKKGRVRAAMTQQLLDAHKAGNVRVAMVRGSDFYGREVLDSGLGGRVFYPLLAGKPAQVVGNVDMPHTYTYIDDFGATMAIVGQHEEAFGQAWHVPNAETLTTRQVIALAAEIMGVEPKLNSMGKTMLRIGGLFIPNAREVIEMLYEFEKPFIVDDGKFTRAFGNEMKATPLRDGLRATIEWYRANPKEK